MSEAALSSPRPVGLASLAGILALAASAGAAAGLGVPGLAAFVPVAAFLLILTIARHPEIGAYAWLLVGPLIVGMPRDDALHMRPNELLLLAILGGTGLSALLRLLRRKSLRVSIGPIDLGIAALVMFGSIVPLLMRYGRGLPLSQDDVLYSLVFIKYALLFCVFRLSVRTLEQVSICLALSLASAAIVAIIALLQVTGFFGVTEFLGAHYDSPFEGSSGPSNARGTSTIASSFGLADTMSLNLAIVVAWLAIMHRGMLLLPPLGALMVAGAVAAGSFSGLIGAAVSIAVVGLLTGMLLRLAMVGIPVLLVSVVAFWPVVAGRISGFGSVYGLPKSWVGRLENLKTFVWPDLFDGFNWVWGVRPAPRIAASETWRDWIYIESGHTWLLWVGGLPLLLTYLLFTWLVVVQLLQPAGGRGMPAVAATAGIAGTLTIFVLMAFDPHLTVRGAADLYFPLLALSVVGAAVAAKPGGPQTRQPT